VDFQERIAIVTGGARGIGRAIVAGLAGAGADVVVADLLESEAERTAREIAAATGRRVEAVPTDVTRLGDVRALVEIALGRFGRVDVLVNSAGWDRLTPFVKTDPDLWDRVLAVNFKGVVHTCHAVLPHMAERKSGSIVNISSDTARVGSFGEAIYASSKAAVIAFSKTLAREHARDNIRVNVVCPGLVDTPLIDEMRRDELTNKIIGSIVGLIPFKRLGTPDEVAPAALFLASDAARYVTGQVLSVNGGLNMVD
jgi:2-hydroxycyclohexanecarboxyl-CoA dehydrogenase